MNKTNIKVKRPTEICPGDQIWRWNPQGWVVVTAVDGREDGTAILRLADGRVVEAYTKKIIR